MKVITEVPSKQKYIWIILWAVLAGLLTLWVFGAEQASAQRAEATSIPPLDNPNPSNAECLACHATPDMFLPLPSGEELLLTVDSNIYNASIHGREGYACIQCHTDISGFPHPDLKAENLRAVSIQKTQTCIRCHTDQSDAYVKGRHAQGLISGNEDTAICVDCHSNHQTAELTTSNVLIVQTCRKCHSEIYDIYQNSVHGSALLQEDNPDVPTCSVCHESHDNTGPGDSGFTLFSPQICANCHADVELMSRYDVNTGVFDTYLADFHGTTVILFEKISPDQETNKPVCVDCHGVHDIQSPTDENSALLKQNLIFTCMRCHPDAPPDFSDAWLSHYSPDLEHNPIVYLVNLFYLIVIPGTIGGMLIFICSDIWKRMKNGSGRKTKRKNECK